MRALVCKAYGSPDDLVIENWPDPDSADDELLIDVRAAGINFADVLSIAGRYQVRTPPPFVAGNEAAGVVAAVGSKVTRFRVGDRVIGALRGGAFAERCVATEALTLPLPDALSFAQGAAYSVAYGTSYHALKQGAALAAGETVLVLGAAGGVGIAAVEIAKALGARVIAAASADDKLEFARESGADETINYDTASLRDAVRELTDGNGVDVVYDPVGGAIAQQAFRATGWHGRYLVIGFASGDIPEFPLNLALLKEASIVGVWWGPWAARYPEAFRENMSELAALVERGALKVRVSAAFPLADYAQAFQQLTEREVLGKTVITFGED